MLFPCKGKLLACQEHLEKKYFVKDRLKFSDTDAVVLRFTMDKSRGLVLLKKGDSTLQIHIYAIHSTHCDFLTCPY